jgi:phosphopantothenoylcysteine decarboxylase/phosphopantothenate--cysteine ligase
MAAAVADYRAKLPEGFDPDTSKLNRDGKLTLELEGTPDLLAGCSATRENQLLVGFALEPRERLEASARAKLARKGLDLIVANPLETMDSGEIEASVFAASGDRSDSGRLDKVAFADWLLDLLTPEIASRTDAAAPTSNAEPQA